MRNDIFDNEMEEYYRLNLGRYVSEHFGEFVLINTYGNHFEESFYANKEEVGSFVEKKYGGRVSAPYLVKKIPESLGELLMQKDFLPGQFDLEIVKTSKDVSEFIRKLQKAQEETKKHSIHFP